MSAPRFQTTSRSTPFSRLDFRAKAAVFLCGTFIAAMWTSPTLLVVMLAAVVGLCFQVGISRTYLGLVFKVMLPFLFLMVVTHGFLNTSHILRVLEQESLTPMFTIHESIWLIGGGVFSWEGFLYGISVACKCLVFLLLVPLCIFTTDPNHLVLALVRMRMPYKLVFVLSSSLRFFPLIFDEINAVIETQRLRGFAVEAMGLAERVVVYSKIAVPVILGAMFKAQQIEVVLMSKGFSGSPNRTFLHEIRMRPIDWKIVIAATAIAILAILGMSAGEVGKIH